MHRHPDNSAAWAGGRWILALALVLVFGGKAWAVADPGDFFTEEVGRFTALLSDSVPERRVEGIQGLSHLKHWPAEEQLVGLLDDPSPLVRHAALMAICRLGTARSVPRLMALLRHPSWEFRQNAWLSLCRMSAKQYPADHLEAWENWWSGSSLADKERALLASLRSGRDGSGPSRHEALRALRHLATTNAEAGLLQFLGRPGAALTVEEAAFAAETLERIGSARAIPWLAAQRSDAAAWALGRIGGKEAERALLTFRKTLAVLLNLDRLHSTQAGPLIPYLVAQMGLVTYRGQPDDLMNADPQPIQRIGANLILRSGQAPALTEQVLLELEYSMDPPPPGPRPPIPAAWRPMLEGMRSELKPGFVREDGVTTSQPVTALSFIAQDRRLVPRLVALLRHPAVVPRIYMAMTLARLRAAEALPALLELIREGYRFSDATALASGKHFDRSQTVRWRGFLCMALGRLGGEEARRALEDLAGDAQQPRDIRFGAVIGLGFIGSPKSLALLRRVAEQDIIWMVREEAGRAAAGIELSSRERER